MGPERTQAARAADHNKPTDIPEVIDRVLHSVGRDTLDRLAMQLFGLV
jgi:hypothetical protein